MVLNQLDIQVECPVLVDKNRSVGIIMPAFKLPYRPYPCYVYLFAAALHLAGMSMRKTASAAAKKFGLPSFNHSTISRMLPKLLSIADLIHSVALPAAPATASCPLFYGRPGWAAEKQQKATTLFESLKSLLADPESGAMLAYRFFMRYCRFLL
jgi:hypothetical protein